MFCVVVFVFSMHSVKNALRLIHATTPLPYKSIDGVRRENFVYPMMHCFVLYYQASEIT